MKKLYIQHFGKLVSVKTALLFNILILTVSNLSGQTVNDTLTDSRRENYKQFILPAALLAGSVVLYNEPVRKEIQGFFPNTQTHVDDWLRYAPIAELYAFDLMGFKHRNTVLVQTGNLVLSQLIAGGVVTLLKNSIHARRPSGGIHSYPSGHTNAAFVGATVLYQEFRDTEPLLAWSGYALAASTGILRVTNDAHWLPDVMAGAAVGILVTNLVYRFGPFNRGLFSDKRLNMYIYPEVDRKSVCLLLTF